VIAGPYDSPQRQLAAVADSCFYLYERQLQRERQPELLIHLPDPLPPLLVLAAAAAAGGGGGQDGKGSRELCIRVEYSGRAGGAGLHFAQQFAATDNQVRGRVGVLMVMSLGLLPQCSSTAAVVCPAGSSCWLCAAGT